MDINTKLNQIIDKLIHVKYEKAQKVNGKGEFSIFVNDWIKIGRFAEEIRALKQIKLELEYLIKLDSQKDI